MISHQFFSRMTDYKPALNLKTYNAWYPCAIHIQWKLCILCLESSKWTPKAYSKLSSNIFISLRNFKLSIDL